MTRFFSFFFLSIFLAFSFPAFAQEDVYEWQNGGTENGADQDDFSSNEKRYQPGASVVSGSHPHLVMALGATAAIVSVVCLGYLKCREYLTDRFRSSAAAPAKARTGFDSVVNTNLATPERCREFARQAQAEVGIRDWGRVPQDKLDAYIKQLKQIAAESGHPIPGTPQ